MYGWYYVLDVMSGGDILKQDLVLEMHFKRILQHMIFLMDVNNSNNSKKK